MNRRIGWWGWSVVAAVFPAGPATAAEQDYRLPDTDVRQQVIWGSQCEGPGGTGLAFGGQDQKSDDGRPHTRVRQDGRWTAIHQRLRDNNPPQGFHRRVRKVVGAQETVTARARCLYLKGLSAEEEAKRVRSELLPAQQQVASTLGELVKALSEAAEGLDGYEAEQARRAAGCLEQAGKEMSFLLARLRAVVTPAAVEQMSSIALLLDMASEMLDAEPPPRALSPIVYDRKSKLYVLFGGDHCDYLTNDTWVFDPAKRKWLQRHPPSAPPPRANHRLTADGSGKVTLSGGYTYTSNTWYCSGQYRDLDDGTWTYDVAENRWTNSEKNGWLVTRTYRTGPFRPDFFLQGPKPDAAAQEKRLAALPANTWVAMDPPHLPQLNRDWGTAVIDPDHDVILRFSGGHSAHGGTDVLHYHLSTNRWELPFPVEFPLGQLYANTRYPDGYNFNLRPWVTGHTYQNYGYDPVLKKMLFAGRPNHCYIYDPVVADWVGRGPKPPGMVYDSCFYTITICPTPQGLVAWTQSGAVFRFDAAEKKWLELETRGIKLPGAVVDNSTIVYDSKRDRLLLAAKPYGDKPKYDGQLYVLDMKTQTAGTLSPEGMAAAAAIPYLCQIRYDATHDLLLVGGTLPPGTDGLRRTPAYDCAANRWISLRITGQDPSGEKGRNVSLGMMYDARRKLFWAVDTNSQVYALRLDPQTADRQPLR